jgi:nonsense-mediated mRNA decay protein 3
LVTVKRVNREERSKWTKFCPQCGKTTDELFESVCKDCFTAGIVLIDPEQMGVTLSVCKNCGCYFRGKERTSIEDAVVNSVWKELKRRYGGGVEIEWLKREIETDGDRASITLTVRTAIKGVEIEETGEIEVNFKHGICERCNRIAGGYYAGIVQIRADDRFPTDDELAIAEKVAYSVLEDPDFISKECELKEGLDIYVSSMECGRRISRGIVEQLGGSFSESSKLYGRKDGRNIYRVSFSVRLPGFKVGTVLRIGGNVISVVRVIKGKGIECMDVNSHEKVFLRKKATKKLKYKTG